MSKSDRPDPEKVESQLGTLEQAVGDLLARFDTVKERLAEVESEHHRLTGILKTLRVNPKGAGNVEERLRALADENSNLREIINEARERAQRIRGRLIVLEDEV